MCAGIRIKQRYGRAGIRWRCATASMPVANKARPGQDRVTVRLTVGLLLLIIE